MEEQNKLLKIIAGIKTDELIVQDEINKQESKKMVKYYTDKGVIEIAPCISYVGENVFMNGEAAPDGKYKLGFMNYINVKNGIVIKYFSSPF
jgi:hypothetical protein